MSPSLLTLLCLTLSASMMYACNKSHLSNIEGYRLPNATKPLQYAISLTLDPEDKNEYGGFIGETRIKILAQKATDIIVLHANKIQISTISVLNNITDLFYGYTEFDDETNFLMIYLNANLTVNMQYTIIINHWSRFGALNGAYRSIYSDLSNKTRWLITTQLAPVSARKVFPCYDEPAMKAKFSIVIHAPNTFFAISNMNILLSKQSHIVGYNVTKFGETPLMSTYLVGFVVSQFSNRISGNIGVYARAELVNDVKYALDIGGRSLKALEHYLGINYPLPKMDYVAVPDFLFGGMENWGLTTFREERFFYNKHHTPSGTESSIAATISHENAHNWFGNEVTPSWWGHVWLKEGFATYFASFINEIIFEGETREVEQFVVNVMQNTMLIDSLKNTNPMTTCVKTASDIMENYNHVAYQKAASVIRMMRNALGEKIFKEGVENYLHKNLFGAADPIDLFNGLQEAVTNSRVLPNNITVEMVFGSWSNQASYPLVRVKRRNNELIIDHERYYRNSTLKSDEQWWIPGGIVTKSKPDFNTTTQFWIRPKTIFKYTVDDADDWFLLNPQQTGYYRVAYEEENWIKLIKTLNSDEFEIIHPLNRAQLLDDAFELAKTDRLPYKIALDLAMYLKRETDFIPWVTAQRALNFVGQFSTLKNSGMHSKFKETLVKSLFESVGFNNHDDDNLVTRLKRKLAIDLACDAHIAACENNITNISVDFFNSTGIEMVHPDLRARVYSHGFSHKYISFDDIWNEFANAPYESERNILLGVMTDLETYQLKKAFVERSIGEDVRNQERTIIITSMISRGDEGMKVVMDFLKESYLVLQKKSQSAIAIAGVIDTLGNKIHDPKDIDNFIELERIYRPHFSSSERKAFERALEVISLNQRWIAEEIPEIEEWLSKKFNSGSIKNVSCLLVITCSLLTFIFR